MKKFAAILLALSATTAYQAVAAHIYYDYDGQSVLGQAINLEGAELSDILIDPPATGAIEEIGTLFVLDIAPWGCYESHAPAVSDESMKITLEGKGQGYNDSPVSFVIDRQLVAKVTPFAVIGGKRYFFNTGLVNAIINGMAMTKTDGQNYDLDLSQVVINPQPAFDADINHDGKIDATDVQLVINAALGIDINARK